MCDVNLYLGLTQGTMPGAPLASLLRALVLCTIYTATAAIAVAPVEVLDPLNDVLVGVASLLPSTIEVVDLRGSVQTGADQHIVVHDPVRILLIHVGHVGDQ